MEVYYFLGSGEYYAYGIRSGYLYSLYKTSNSSWNRIRWTEISGYNFGGFISIVAYGIKYGCLYSLQNATEITIENSGECQFVRRNKLCCYK